jgi:hypothetical protein
MAGPIPNPQWSADEWIVYLRDGLKKSVFNDVVPLLGVPAALFSPARLALCYVDYLGALREGALPTDKDNGLATSAKAMKFIEEVFGKVHPEYQTKARILYTCYRHGLVHQFAPKILQRKDGRTLAWLVYHGDRSAFPYQHLHINVDVGGTHDSLHISVNCLVYDLISAIEVFMNEIATEKAAGKQDLLVKMQSAATVLAKPHEGTFQW